MSRRQIVWAFVAVICLPALTVLWLGSRLLSQDRDLEAQRRQESSQRAADHAVRVLQAALSDQSLFVSRPDQGAVFIAYPSGAALFRIDPDALPEASGEAFRSGEELEFRGDAEGAIAAYRPLADSKAAEIRAGAWLRLARTLRGARRYREALTDYSELAKFDHSAAGGWPAPLVAAWGRCSVLEEMNEQAELRAVARDLRRMLDSGQWQLSKSSYEMFAEDAAKWTGEPRPLEQERLTVAAHGLWEQIRKCDLPGDGRQLTSQDDERVTLVWKPLREGTGVLAASPAFVEHALLKRAGGDAWLRDDAGHDLTPAQRGNPVLRYSAETGLPWTVAAIAPPDDADTASRRRLLLSLLAFVALLSMAGGYLVLRALRREFALTRLQSDFVSAVSHEFRTPLTSMRLVTEALESGRIPDEERKQASYRSLARATNRLHRLVEDLLDFRRMESGATEYSMITLDAAEIAREATGEFRNEVSAQGFHVNENLDAGIRIRGDREALSRALRNLLDNAAKYSGDSRAIDVRVERNGTGAYLSVSDRGIGIRPEDRGQLFSRFYRAEEARRAGIPGTGIGLAIVAQIVTAHRGRISVESEPGRASTFTIWLPAEEG